MARIRNDEAERFVPSSSGEWFTLKNDGDVARVQFLFPDCSELDVFSAHKIKLGDKERYVDCLRHDPADPLDVCPLCNSNNPLKVVRFVVMYDLTDKKIKVWERGKQFIQKLEGLANRYYPLSDTVFEIERHGKAGDKQTTYEIFPCPNIPAVNIEDIEKPELLGSVVLSKTYEEIQYYLNTGSFPDDTQVSEAAPRQRRAPVNAVPTNTPEPVATSRRAVNNTNIPETNQPVSTSRRSRRS